MESWLLQNVEFYRSFLPIYVSFFTLFYMFVNCYVFLLSHYFCPLKPALSRLKLAVSLLVAKRTLREFNCELIMLITEENSIKQGQKKYHYTPAQNVAQ